MMIRQPIPRSWRIGLGIASIVLPILLYTLLSASRQAAKRREQQQRATRRLEEIRQELQGLERSREAALRIEDGGERQQELDRLEANRQHLEQQNAEQTRLSRRPDATDLTVPSWGLLYKDGLIRVCTARGPYVRKEIMLVSDFKVTAARLVTALLVGVAASVLLGLLMGCWDPVEAFFMPPFTFLSKVPATAVLPVFFVLVQINFRMYIAIIVFGMLPTLAQSISQSVRKDVPNELIFKAFTLGASQLELIWEVIYKQVLPRILDAARLQIGPALVLLVAAEWMVAGEGIGYQLRIFYQRTDMTVVFVYVLILGALGLAADYTLIWSRRKLCPWFGE
jgi:ABC-type nitrate/sulfonate/bicarbonate transport system permease component